MKIIHLLSQTQLTGAEVFTQSLTDELIQLGHQVWVFSDKFHLPFKSKTITMKIHPRGFLLRLKNILNLRKLITSEQIQVVHTHSRAGVRVGYWATFGTKCALVSHIHGRQHSSFSKRIFDQYGDKVFGVCENILESLTNDFKMNTQKMKLFRNPVNLKNLGIVEKLNPQLRIGILGRFTGPKGERLQQIITKCFEKWLLSEPLLHIEIIGGDPKLLSQQVLDFIQELNRLHGPRIEIKEHVADLKSELKNYQFVIAAGRIAIESITQGIPCVALGEYSFEGLVTPLNYHQQVKSNFGDMGVLPSDLMIDYKIFSGKILEIIDFLKTHQFEEDRIKLANMARQDFSLQILVPKMIRHYESVIFKKNVPSWIPILMYHQVLPEANSSPHRIFVTAETFEAHLQYFIKNGFTTLHFKDLQEYRLGKKDINTFPKKPLLLTFDDGYKNNLSLALPLLEKYQCKAIVYLLANNKMPTNSWDLQSGAPSMELLNTAERISLQSSPWIEIGSHGFDHKKLTEMNDQDAKNELELSKRDLENEFKTKIISYAYTYGLRTDRDVHLAENAGYEYAVNTDHGALHLEDHPWSIFRVNIFPEDGPSQLRKKTSSWYRRYYFFKRGK